MRFVAAGDFPTADEARVATEDPPADAAPGSCAQTHTPCAPATASVEPALGRQATRARPRAGSGAAPRGIGGAARGIGVDQHAPGAVHGGEPGLMAVPRERRGRAVGDGRRGRERAAGEQRQRVPSELGGESGGVFSTAASSASSGGSALPASGRLIGHRASNPVPGADDPRSLREVSSSTSTAPMARNGALDSA